MSWTWLLYLSSGVVATVIAAHVMTRKSRQAPPPSEEKPVPAKVEIEIKLPVTLYPSWFASFPIALEEPDPEMAAQLDELERRLEHKERRASPTDQRRMEYVRYLVQTKRLNEGM